MPKPEEKNVEGTPQSNNKGDETTEAAEDILSDETAEAKEGDPKIEDVLGDEAPDDKSKDAPESYEDFNVPERFELEEDQAVAFNGLAKGLGLSQENAQKMSDFRVQVEKARENKTVQAINEWAKEAKADPDIMQNKDAIKQTLTTMPEPLRDIFKKIGITNNPDFLKWLINVGKGKHTQEQSIINGDSRSTKPMSDEDKMINQSLKNAGMI